MNSMDEFIKKLNSCEVSLNAEEFDKVRLHIYQKGVSRGMHVGIALGRFYEKHGITDKIPDEYVDECNQIIENAMRECEES